MQSHNDPEGERLNRITRFELVSIIKAGIPPMKLMIIINGVQRYQKIMEVENKMNLLLLSKAFTKTIGN